MTRPNPGRNITLLLMLFILNWALLAGCATLGKEECFTADWYTIGYEDGARGYPASRIGEHREACAKHGIAPGFAPYEQGRLAGLQEYCTPQRGYSLGVSGKAYTYVCPDDLERDFSEAYERGRAVHDAKVTVNRQKADLKKMHAELAAVKQKLSEYESELVRDGSIGPRRRKYLLEEIKILTAEQHTIEAAIIEQETLLEISRRNLQQTREQNSY